MKKNDLRALRIISSAVMAILAVAILLVRGPFWLNFVLGTACGLSVGMVVIAWRKQLDCVDEKISPRPLELKLGDPHGESR